MQVLYFHLHHWFIYLYLSDLRPAFHWNLKQLFVFVVAEYETKANVIESIVRLHPGLTIAVFKPGDFVGQDHRIS